MEYIEFMKRTVVKAAEIVLKSEVKVSQKGEKDLVTNLDYEVEKFIIGEIKKNYGDIAIVSEEFNANNIKSDQCFIIDPIDGTVNFAMGLPLWCIQIAYVSKGETIASVIYLPELNRMYHAKKGNGAYLNDIRINIKKRGVNNAMVDILGPILKDKKYDIAKDLNKEVLSIRQIGSAGVSFGFLSEGCLASTLLLQNKLWDIEPGLLLCEEAGAISHRTDTYLLIAAEKEVLDIVKNAIDKHTSN